MGFGISNGIVVYLLNNMTNNMNANQKSSADHIIEHLNAIEIDGETMEYIIKGVGMSYQMLRQLIMKSSDFDINNIISSLI